jgi:hypothetical protein
MPKSEYSKQECSEHPRERFSALTLHRQLFQHRIVSSAWLRAHVAQGGEFQDWISAREKGRNAANGGQTFGVYPWVKTRASSLLG